MAFRHNHDSQPSPDPGAERTPASPEQLRELASKTEQVWKVIQRRINSGQPVPLAGQPIQFANGEAHLLLHIENEGQGDEDKDQALGMGIFHDDINGWNIRQEHLRYIRDLQSETGRYVVDRQLTIYPTAENASVISEHDVCRRTAIDSWDNLEILRVEDVEVLGEISSYAAGILTHNMNVLLNSRTQSGSMSLPTGN